MDTFIKIFIVLMLVLACIGWLADRRAADRSSNVTPGLSLLPGDIKYGSPNGNVRIYFYRDIDCPFSRAHADPPLLQLIATHAKADSVRCYGHFARRIAQDPRRTARLSNDGRDNSFLSGKLSGRIMESDLSAGRSGRI